MIGLRINVIMEIETGMNAHEDISTYSTNIDGEIMGFTTASDFFVSASGSKNHIGNGVMGGSFNAGANISKGLHSVMEGVFSRDEISFYYKYLLG